MSVLWIIFFIKLPGVEPGSFPMNECTEERKLKKYLTGVRVKDTFRLNCTLHRQLKEPYSFETAR